MTTFFSLQTLYDGWRKTFVNNHATEHGPLSRRIIFCLKIPVVLWKIMLEPPKPKIPSLLEIRQKTWEVLGYRACLWQIRGVANEIIKSCLILQARVPKQREDQLRDSHINTRCGRSEYVLISSAVAGLFTNVFLQPS